MDSLAKLRIAAYARFSSDNQRETSIEDQVRQAQEFVEKNDGRLPEDFVLTDFAVSGVSRARSGFDRLLQLIEKREIDVFVTESASRLSRDLGDADRLWKLCEYHRVRVICIADGVDSARDGARMQYQMNAVISDQYLVKLGKETLRGLRGAAKRGECTGGLPYGYCSRPRWNGGREPEGYEILVDPDRSKVVVRIFELCRDGYSLLLIAKTLNNEAVPSPRAASKKGRAKFWRKGTIREILRNPAYIGQWSFGERQWQKHPLTRKRIYRQRPKDEVFAEFRPHLRIVSEELWNAVQERLRLVTEKYRGKGSGAPGRRTAWPFSGLLVCGTCGRPMVDAGGSAFRYYRCSGAHSGGICANRQPVREDVLVAEAIRELTRVVTETGLYEQLRQRVEARLKTFALTVADDEGAFVRQITKLDGDIARLVAFIRDSDLPPTSGALREVTASLDKAADERRRLQAKLDEVRLKPKAPPRLPTTDEIVKLVTDITGRFKDEPVRAREQLRKMLEDGVLRMYPQPDGSYRAESVIFPLHLGPNSRKPRSIKTEAPGTDKSVDIDGCAGRI